MKKSLTIALAALVLGAGASAALTPDPTFVGDAANLAVYDLGALSETDLVAVSGARRVACTGDLTMAQLHFLAGNPVAGVFHLLAAYLRPAICS